MVHPRISSQAGRVPGVSLEIWFVASCCHNLLARQMGRECLAEKTVCEVNFVSVIRRRRGLALAGWPDWREHHLIHQNIAGLITSPGTCGRPINVSLSHAHDRCFSLSLSTPSPLASSLSQVRIKKRKRKGEGCMDNSLKPGLASPMNFKAKL